jgi:hypothetical protein
MNLFEKAVGDAYVKYHTNPYPVNSLDPRVFYFPPDGGEPQLQPKIKTQIMVDINTINSAEGESGTTRCKDYMIVGPILKEKSSSTCPLIVKVQIDTTNLADVLKEKILETIKNLNGHLADGSQHPLEYLPTIRTLHAEDYDAAYHPYTNKWLKKPRFLGESVKSLEGLVRDPAKKKRRHSLIRSMMRSRLLQTK